MGWANFVINLPLITFWKCAQSGHTEFRSFWSLKILFWVAYDLRLLFPSSVTRLGNLLKFGQLLKPLTTINLPKSPTFLGNFCKGVKIYHFSSEIIFGQLLQTFGNFFWSHWKQGTAKVLNIDCKNADFLHQVLSIDILKTT